jgi:hypothetical protein
MRTKWLVVVSVLVMTSLSAVAADLSLEDLLRAHNAGIAGDTLIQLVEAADSVPVLTAEDESRLIDSGVPSEVIDALKQRHSQVSPPAATAEPDDRRLVEMVRLVRAGLSADLIVRKIESGSERYRPTVNDLVYLKQNTVPDSVIAALMATVGSASAAEAAPSAAPPAVGSTLPAPAPSSAELERRGLEFGPMLRLTSAAAVFKKRTEGNVLLIDDRIEYRDREDAKRNVAFFGSILKRVQLECIDPEQMTSCTELILKPGHGDDLRLVDLDWERGGNREIIALYDALRDRYPRAKYKLVKD